MPNFLASSPPLHRVVFVYTLAMSFTRIVTQWPRRFRLSVALAAYLLGLAVGTWYVWPVSVFYLYIGIGLLGLFFLIRSYGMNLIFITLGMIVLGYYWGATHLHPLILKEPLTYVGKAEVLSVRFREPPQQRVLVRLLDGPRSGTAIQAYTYDFITKPGTIVAITADIAPSKYKSDRGRNVIGSSSNVIITKELSPPSLIYQFRRQISERMGATLPEPYASLAVGLLTGAGDDFDTSFREDLQRTGTTHLVAVSGYNLTIVALMLQRLGQRKSRWLGFGLACSALAFYVVLAGANPSILRGASVAFLSLLALVTGRITHRLTLVLLSATVLSFITPLGMLYSLSWQLSFLAFVGIIFLAPVLTPLFKRFGLLGASLGDTLSAELLTLPLLLYQFGSLSVVAPFVNAVVLGFIPLAMGLSALQAFASLITIKLGMITAWLSYPILWLVVKPIQWSSELPFAAYDVGNYTWVYFVLSYTAVIGLFIFLLGVQKNETQ